MIQTENLTKIYKNSFEAVDSLNIYVEEGDIFGFLGPNGAGKTTLMRVLTTVLSSTSGTVTLDGMLYNGDDFEKIQRKIGYLPQEIDLYPNLTVQECVKQMVGY